MVPPEPRHLQCAGHMSPVHTVESLMLGTLFYRPHTGPRLRCAAGTRPQRSPCKAVIFSRIRLTLVGDSSFWDQGLQLTLPQSLVLLPRTAHSAQGGGPLCSPQVLRPAPSPEGESSGPMGYLSHIALCPVAPGPFPGPARPSVSASPVLGLLLGLQHPHRGTFSLYPMSCGLMEARLQDHCLHPALITVR